MAPSEFGVVRTECTSTRSKDPCVGLALLLSRAMRRCFQEVDAFVTRKWCLICGSFWRRRDSVLSSVTTLIDHPTSIPTLF
jgi:hypothetical protein